MERKNKIQILLEKPNAKTFLLALILLIIVVPLWYASKQNIKTDGTRGNKNLKTFTHKESGITKDEMFEGLKFTNIKMTTKDGYTTFEADVINTTNHESNIENVFIDLKDKKGKVVMSLVATIRSNLKPKESDRIISTASGKFKNVVSKSIRKYVESEVQEDETVEPEEVEIEESQDV